MTLLLKTLAKLISSAKNKRQHQIENILADFAIIKSAREVVIQKAVIEVLNAVSPLVSPNEGNLDKANINVKELLADIKDNYEDVLYASYEMPEDMRLEATAKVKTVNKLLRML